jgi:hypothetical protein
MIGGIHRKIQAAHTKLCASRAFYLSAYPTQTQEMLYDAHTRAFTALGGITQRGMPQLCSREHNRSYVAQIVMCPHTAEPLSDVVNQVN